MSENNLDRSLIVSLNTFCGDLMTVLRSTEASLAAEREKYNQVVSVCKPWPPKKQKSLESRTSIECTCVSTTTEILNNSNSSNTNLLENIPKIVSKTKALRIEPSKCNSKNFLEAKKSIKNCINKTDIQNTSNDKLSKKSSVKSLKLGASKSTITVQTSSSSKTRNLTLKGSSLHNPSCRLYNLETVEKIESYSNLSEAVNSYGIPSSLSKVLKQYHEFVLNFGKPQVAEAKKSKDFFYKTLQKHNKDNWKKVVFSVEKLPKYMSALYSIEQKCVTSDVVPFIIYHNIAELQKYEDNKSKENKRKLWDIVLKSITVNIAPILEGLDISERERIYVYKMIKTISNFSQSPVPTVPIFRINENI